MFWGKQREVEMVAEGSGGSEPGTKALVDAPAASQPDGGSLGVRTPCGSAELGGLISLSSSESSLREMVGAGSSGSGGGCCGSELFEAGGLLAALTAARPEAASVRQKAAYFEAMIRSNTDTLVRCAASTDGQACRRGGGSEDMDLGSEGSDSDIEQWQDYSEVQLVLRVPKGAARQPLHPQYGSTEEMAALIEQLQAQLAVKDREKQLTASALHRKTQECENLMRVVRELADGRSKLVATKASLQERHAELQHEYHRMLRVAELSRTVSKENLAKTSRTQKALRQAEDELHSTRKQAATLQSKGKKLKVENAQLKERLCLLERLDVFDGVQESASMREFTRSRVAETY